MRHKEPELLIQWREWDKAGAPKLCHTCDSYNRHGQCERYGSMTPPEDFAATPGACEGWLLGVPF